jgi:Ca2+/H+ antiporter, TMEM165/GDT1 family
MSISVVAVVFALVALAELPDKTMIATLVMGSRSRPVLVWIGACSAFAVHVVLAVLAGHLLSLLPHRALEIVITVLFLSGAVYLLFVPERAEVEEGVREAGRAPPGIDVKVVGAAFGVILVGELGDLTQLLTVNLVARYHQPWSVFVGAFAALATVSAIGAFGGQALVRVLPLSRIRRVGGVVLLGFAGYTIYSLLR